jgi:hypothetical protein
MRYFEPNKVLSFISLEDFRYNEDQLRRFKYKQRENKDTIWGHREYISLGTAHNCRLTYKNVYKELLNH